MQRAHAVVERPARLPRKPPCFTEREYTSWVLADLDRCLHPFAPDPCVDCTRAFAEEMRFEGRCDSEPGETALKVANSRQSRE